MGTAFRKVVLVSDDANGVLPEGNPDGAVLGDITVGLADGFFGKGMGLNVKFMDSSEKIHIDLRHCVSKNLYFFQSAWQATMFFFAQQAAMSESDKVRYKIAHEKFGNQFAFCMMQLPHAMKTCGISKEKEQMLMDAVKAFGSGVQVSFDTPKTSPNYDAISGGMKLAVQAWQKKQWYMF